MIAIDTNLLVYAHRPELPAHEVALKLLRSLPVRGGLFGLPWPCAHEFLAVVTNPRIFRDPTPSPVALAAARALADSESIRMLGEGAGYLDHLTEQVTRGGVRGGMVHDARIAAICRYHGVRELWSADRDFGRFPDLRIVNPLIHEP